MTKEAGAGTASPSPAGSQASEAAAADPKAAQAAGAADAKATDAPANGEAKDLLGAESGKGKEAADGAAEGKDKPAGAPETYEAFAMPEGLEMDAEALKIAEPVLRDLNLSQAQAQKAVDAFVALMPHYLNQAGVLDPVHQANEWYDATAADAEIGGGKLETTLAAANRALNAYGSPGLRQLLRSTGVGNNIEMVKFFHKIGLTVTEDQHGKNPTGGQSAVSDTDQVRALYPSMQK